MTKPIIDMPIKEFKGMVNTIFWMSSKRKD